LALGNAATKVRAAGHLGPGAENYLYGLQPGAVAGEPGACQCRAVATRAGLRKTEKQRAVAGKVGVQQHIEQTALAPGRHLGQADQRRIDPAIGLDDTQAPGAFGQQKPAFGQKSQRPGMRQAGGDDLVAQ